MDCFDIAIIGGGPAGLACAASLAGHGLSILVAEAQPAALLAEPRYDGREIAVTHGSQGRLHALGAWQRLPAAEIAPLREARVLNGGSAFALSFDPAGKAEPVLGRLVPNHLLRRALHDVVAEAPDVTLVAGAQVASINRDPSGATIRFKAGAPVRASLVIAADSRFSEIRRAQGISARVQRFGKSMLVCRVAHDRPHDGIATEWFDYGHTIAMLPLNGHRSSAVITMPPEAIDRLMAMDDEALGAEITRLFRTRLGPMRMDGTRHVYPLAAVYADRFVAHRLALIGDAAVAMHPVTAHGFNFGLRGATSLAAEILAANILKPGDVGSAAALRRYEAGHRRATRLLWAATNATALLYSAQSPPARLLREGVLRLGRLARPLVVKHLMGAEDTARGPVEGSAFPRYPHPPGG